MLSDVQLTDFFWWDINQMGEQVFLSANKTMAPHHNPIGTKDWDGEFS